MALDEIYDGYCIVCNHCSRYYRFDPRTLSAARGWFSFDEHGNPRGFVLKGKNMIAHWAKRDGWSSYLGGRGLPRRADNDLSPVPVLPIPQRLRRSIRLTGKEQLMIPILSDDGEYYEFTESCDRLFDLMMPGDWVTLDTNLGFFITGQLVMQVVDDFEQGLLFEGAQPASDLRRRFDGEGARGVFILNHATVGDGRIRMRVRLKCSVLDGNRAWTPACQSSSMCAGPSGMMNQYLC